MGDLYRVVARNSAFILYKDGAQERQDQWTLRAAAREGTKYASSKRRLNLILFVTKERIGNEHLRWWILIVD